MKILYTHYLDHDDHPAVRMVQAITNELRGFGHEVLVHASRSAGGAPRGTTTRSGLDRWLRGRLWFAKTMRFDRKRRPIDLDVIGRFGPDVVLARQDAYRSSMAWAATQAGVPLVTYADAPVAYEVRTFRDGTRWHPPGLVEAIERETLTRSRRVVTVSHPSAQILGRYRTGTPIDVAPNGVDPARFPILRPADRIRRRESLGIHEPIVVGFQGTFKAFHGLERLRDLISRTTHREDVRWLLIGDGPGLASLSGSLRGCERVTFLGRRPSAEMGELLALLDIAVAPHDQDAGLFYFSPLKILEYAAAGCAILASDQGDIPAMLDGGNAALLLKGAESDRWNEALARLLDDPFASRKLGESARRFVLENRTWGDTAFVVETALCAACRPRECGRASMISAAI